eukprot:jgi/Chlat1/4416/Chrsp29S04544
MQASRAVGCLQLGRTSVEVRGSCAALASSCGSRLGVQGRSDKQLLLEGSGKLAGWALRRSTATLTSVRRAGPHFVVCCGAAMATNAPAASQGPSLADASAPAPRLLLVSDLDSTMVDHEDPDHTSLHRFNEVWTSQCAHDSLLVFSTGRSPTMYQELRDEAPLITPDIRVMSVGTEIFIGADDKPDEGWLKKLDEGWDRKVVEEVTKGFSELKLQRESEQRPHKVSFNIDPATSEKVIPILKAKLLERGVEAKLVYSGSWDLDVMSKNAGKGQALSYIVEKLAAQHRSPTRGILVCGDSGNDAELFTVPRVHGCMVSNAMKELKEYCDAHPDITVHRATQRCAGGIVEAMESFEFIPLPLLVGAPPLTMGLSCASAGSMHALLVDTFRWLTQWYRGESENTDDEWQRLAKIFAAEFSIVVPSGQVLSREQMLRQLRGQHGRESSHGNHFYAWVDRVHPVVSGANLRVATFTELHEAHGSGKRVAKQNTLVFREKEGSPHGLEWVHLHETRLG